MINRNFRGVGESLEMMAFYDAKQAVSLNGTESLPLPNMRVKWSDCAIGKSSRVSVGASNQHSLESLRNLVGGGSASKVSVISADLHAALEGQVLLACEGLC